MTHRLGFPRRPVPFVNGVFVPNTIPSSQVALRGSLITVIGTWTRLAIHLGTTVILARLLGPTEFGVIGMLLAFAGVAEVLRDSGLSTASIHAPILSERQTSYLAYTSIGMGLALGIAIYAGAPLLALFYGEPALADLARVMSVPVFLAGATSQHTALLARDMRFTALAMTDVVATALSAIAAISLAIAGTGPWSLLAYYSGQVVFRGALAVMLADWRPGRPAKTSEVRTLLGFGFAVLVQQTFNYAARNADNVIVGRHFGPRVLGYYVQAYQLLLLPLTQIGAPMQRVALPVLSRLVADPPRYRRYYQTSARSMWMVVWPGIGVAAVLAPSLIHTVLGAEWLPAARLFRVLSLAAMAQAIGYLNAWLLLSTGQAMRQAQWALSTRPLIVLVFLVSSRWGVTGMALAYSVSSVLLVVPGYLFSIKGTPVQINDVCAALVGPTILTTISMTASACPLLIFQELAPAVALASGATAALLAYVSVLALWPSLRRETIDVLRLVAPDRSWKKGGP